MKKEFMVERNGKSFVLYAGLLDLAHTNGLTNISTEIVQIPHESNNRVAIVTAVATFEKDGKVTSFTGIGDAAPNNVAPAMQTCLLRMAETRAKARCLRDGTNIGMASLEELGNEEGETSAPQNRYAPKQSRQQAPRTQETQPAKPPTANKAERTEAAKNAEILNKSIADECKRLNYAGDPDTLFRFMLDLPENAALTYKLKYEAYNMDEAAWRTAIRAIQLPDESPNLALISTEEVPVPEPSHAMDAYGGRDIPAKVGGVA